MCFPVAGWPLDCPPEDAAGADGVYYHMLKSWPPHATKDLRTSHESKNKAIITRNPCQACGLSVYPDPELVRDNYARLVESNPALRGNWKHVAMMTLTTAFGKVKETDGGTPRHHTWWPCDGLSRESALQHYGSLEEAEGAE